MPVFERHGWCFGLLEYWDRARDVIAVHLVVSRDGRQWSAPLRDQPFIGPVYPWNRAWSSCANNGPLLFGELVTWPWPEWIIRDEYTADSGPRVGSRR